jgi:hypothetical protein
MSVSYIVGSPGRSGSIFVALTIARSLNIRAVMSNQEPLAEDDTPVVYHSHDAQRQLDPNTTMLHIIRRYVFAEIVSATVCEQYNEWFYYTGNKPPFAADIEQFEQKYHWHKYWHQAHRALTYYCNRQELVFEDFIGRSEVVCDALGIPRVHVSTKKNPYSADNILNIDQLKHRFNELESQPAPTTWDPEQWKDLKAK